MSEGHHYTLIEGFQLSKQRRNVPFAPLSQPQTVVFAHPLPPAVSAQNMHKISSNTAVVHSADNDSTPDVHERQKRVRFMSDRPESADPAVTEHQQPVAKVVEDNVAEVVRQDDMHQCDIVADASSAILPPTDDGDALADAVAETAQCFRDVRATAKALAEVLEEKLSMFESYAIAKFQEIEHKRRVLAELEDRIRVVQDVAQRYDMLFDANN